MTLYPYLLRYRRALQYDLSQVVVHEFHNNDGIRFFRATVPSQKNGNAYSTYISTHEGCMIACKCNCPDYVDERLVGAGEPLHPAKNGNMPFRVCKHGYMLMLATM